MIGTTAQWRVLNDSPVYQLFWTQVTVVYIQKILKEINYTTCRNYASHMIIRHCKHTNSLSLVHYHITCKLMYHLQLTSPSTIPLLHIMHIIMYFCTKTNAHHGLHAAKRTDWDLESKQELLMDSLFLEVQASLNVIRLRFEVYVSTRSSTLVSQLGVYVLLVAVSTSATKCWWKWHAIDLDGC